MPPRPPVPAPSSGALVPTLGDHSPAGEQHPSEDGGAGQHRVPQRQPRRGGQRHRATDLGVVPDEPAEQHQAEPNPEQQEADELSHARLEGRLAHDFAAWGAGWLFATEVTDSALNVKPWRPSISQSVTIRSLM